MNHEDSLYIKAFGHYLSVSYNHKNVETLISNIYYHLLTDKPLNLTLEYTIYYQPSNSNYVLTRKGHSDLYIHSESDLIYYFEKDFTIELQKLLKDDLFFIHGAVLTKHKQTFVISGRSGAGKSTTTLGLLQSGYQYVSDELAPTHIETLIVKPFPHAICLKSPPPAPYTLPDSTIKLNRTWHVPVTHDAYHLDTPPPLSFFVFLEYDARIASTQFYQMDTSEAAINIYKNALNQLAYPNDGLNAAYRLANDTDSFYLRFSELDHAIEHINSITR